MHAIGQMLKAFDNGLTRIRSGFTNGIRSLFGDRFAFVFSRCIIGLVALFILVKQLLVRLNKLTFSIEKVLVVIATLAMTALVFNVYLIEQKTAFSAGSNTEPTTADSAPPAAVEIPSVTEQATPSATAASVQTGPVDVLVTGDGQNVQLNREGSVFDLPGTVERGSYTVRAQFDGWDAQGEAGEIKLEGEGPITIKCDSFTESCRVKKKRKIRPDWLKPSATQASSANETGPVTIEILGSPLSVELRRDNETLSLPGTVAPGDYSVHAQFEGWDNAQEVGQITVSPPGPVQLKCDPFTETCRIKKKRKKTCVHASSKPGYCTNRRQDRTACSAHRDNGSGWRNTARAQWKWRDLYAPGRCAARPLCRTGQFSDYWPCNRRQYRN